MTKMCLFGNVSKNMFDLRMRLVSLRRENRLSQEDLAEDLDIPRSTIASWEAGCRVPKVTHIAMLAEYYDVTVDYLLGLSEGKNTYMCIEELKIVVNNELPVSV